jgi:hypothetical protein
MHNPDDEGCQRDDKRHDQTQVSDADLLVGLLEGPLCGVWRANGPYRFVGDDRLVPLLPDRDSVKTSEGTSVAVLPWPGK